MSGAGKTLWVDYLSRPVVAATASAYFAAASCDDGQLHVYTPTGRRCATAAGTVSHLLTLSAQRYAAHEARRSGSLALRKRVYIAQHIGSRDAQSLVRCEPADRAPTLTFMCRDVKLDKALFQPVSVAELLLSAASTSSAAPVTVAYASALANGSPVVGLTNGEAYTYDHHRQAWIVVSQPWWEKGSSSWESRRNRGTSTGRGPVRHAESVTADILLETAAPNGDAPPTEVEGETKQQMGRKEDFALALTLGHLESRMGAAILLDSPAEYKAFLLQYAKLLNEEGFRSKAEELCKELLGPIYMYVPFLGCARKPCRRDHVLQRLSQGRDVVQDGPGPEQARASPGDPEHLQCVVPGLLIEGCTLSCRSLLIECVESRQGSDARQAVRRLRRDLEEDAKRRLSRSSPWHNRRDWSVGQPVSGPNAMRCSYPALACVV